MPRDSIQDSTRYVVSDLHHGSILPGKRSEMLRDVFLISGADIRGGVYAHELLVEGSNISVEKSVYTSKSIIFKDGKNKNNKSNNHFGSTVVASDSILMENKDIKNRFKSDIYCTKLNISNSIVYGNIFVNSAIISNSIILGGIFCRDNLKISNSIYSTFRANTVELGSNLHQLFPVALSQTPIELKSRIKTITFLNIFNKMEDNTGSGVVELDEDDIFEVDENFLAKEEYYTSNESVKKKLYCLSIAERILNTEKIIEHFKQNKLFIESLALESHLKPDEKMDEYNKPLDELEKYLWSLLEGNQQLPSVEGVESIKTLFERMKKKFHQQKV